MRQRNVPVFCGEFGVYRKNALPEDRLRYYQFVRETLEARNIPWITYGYFDPFGMYNSLNEGDFDWFSWGDINTDLNVELVQALGLTPIPQRQREPLKTGFTIYDDYTGRGFRLRWYSEQSKVNMYYTQAAEGEYAIQWKDISRHNAFEIGLNVIDLSYLAQNGFALEFKARSEKPAALDVNFWHFEDNIFWQNSQNIQITPDGNWHTIRIPLKDMELWGGSEDVTWQWHEPKGRVISWTNITTFQLLATHEDGAREIYLDDIKITR